MVAYDPAKRAGNLEKHGVDLADAAAFELGTAITRRDPRAAEERYVPVGFIGARLHVMVWTPRDGTVRVISLRKANRRETRTYADAHA